MKDEKMYKIKIQRGDTLIEVEGDKEFVESKYQDWLVTLQETKPENVANQIPVNIPIFKNSKKRKSSQNQRSGYVAPKPVELKIDKQELQTFYNSKTPSSHEEKFLVFGFFLKEKGGLSEVTANEIFSCYRLLGVKGPKAWIQKFRDAKSRKSWFNKGSEPGRYVISTIGEEYVIHDMPGKTNKESE